MPLPRFFTRRRRIPATPSVEAEASRVLWRTFLELSYGPAGAGGRRASRRADRLAALRVRANRERIGGEPAFDGGGPRLAANSGDDEPGFTSVPQPLAPAVGGMAAEFPAGGGMAVAGALSKRSRTNAGSARRALMAGRRDPRSTRSRPATTRASRNHSALSRPRSWLPPRQRRLCSPPLNSLRAAWHIYIEAASRLPSPALAPGGDRLGAAIASLEVLADEVRANLKTMRPGRSGRDGDTIEGHLLRLLQEGLTPFLAEWRPRHARFQQTARPETKWGRAEACRDALAATRDRCLPIVRALGRQVNAPILTEMPLQLPAPLPESRPATDPC